jgi:hypothetical protein
MVYDLNFVRHAVVTKLTKRHTWHEPRIIRSSQLYLNNQLSCVRGGVNNVNTTQGKVWADWDYNNEWWEVIDRSFLYGADIEHVCWILGRYINIFSDFRICVV